MPPSIALLVYQGVTLLSSFSKTYVSLMDSVELRIFRSMTPESLPCSCNVASNSCSSISFHPVSSSQSACSACRGTPLPISLAVKALVLEMKSLAETDSD
ncbi:hypothetical protein Tco_0016073 [Tanacetum coccineum]